MAAQMSLTNSADLNRDIMNRFFLSLITSWRVMKEVYSIVFSPTFPSDISFNLR
jgi:hypothetical protein